MGKLDIILIGDVLVVLFVPSVRNAIAGFFVRTAGEQVQRSLTGGKLFDEAGADVQREITGGQTFAEAGATFGGQAVSFGEQLQKNLFGGLLIK